MAERLPVFLFFRLIVSGDRWRPRVAGGGKMLNSSEDRIVGLGTHFRVTGDGHGHQEFRHRQFGHRQPAPGIRRLMAERLTSERPTSVADTRHHS